VERTTIVAANLITSILYRVIFGSAIRSILYDQGKVSTAPQSRTHRSNERV